MKTIFILLVFPLLCEFCLTLIRKCVTTIWTMPNKQRLMIFFVTNASKYYCATFTTYNVHNLIHLHNDVRHFGLSFDEISCFPSENYLQVLKKYVRNSRNSLNQIVKRVQELETNT